MILAAAFSACGSEKELEREAEDFDNIKQAYIEIITRYLDDGDASLVIEVQSQQETAGWQGEAPILYYAGGGPGLPIPACTGAGQSYIVALILDDNDVVMPSITVH
ncbi:MAG: hypothetical protein IIY94_04735 [Oscillospiraceae bacterium]|nr:hypothetical protein [Oscillospiraceae bacterium]